MKALLFTPKVRSVENLQAWAAQHGWKSQPVDKTAQVLQDIHSYADSFSQVLVVDHPFDKEQDQQLLTDFYAAATEQDGAFYYTPRPNPYLDVTDIAFLSLQGLEKIRGTKKQGFKDSLLASYSSLPPSLRRVAKTLGSPLRSWLLSAPPPQVVAAPPASVVAPTGGSTPAEVPGPDIKLPSVLNTYQADWQNWIPSKEVLHTELIERMGDYFPSPRGLHVIVLNKCNLSCVMCPYHSPQYKEHHKSGYFDDYRAMSMETFKKIADYAARTGTALQFGQIEEVLMHKRFFDFLAYAKEVGVPHIHVTTNGVMLTPDKADLLADSSVKSVMFSVDASTPETYRQIRGSDLDQLEENARYFIAKAKEKGIKTWASFILQDQSKDEKEAFVQKWRATGVDYITFYVLTAHNPETGAFLRSEEIYNKGKRYPCASPWMQAVIFPEGEISLCCKTMTEVGWKGVVSVGSLQNQSFEEIWVSPRYGQVREELLNNRFKEFKTCADCQIWSASTSLQERGNGYVRSYNETMETYEFSSDI